MPTTQTEGDSAHLDIEYLLNFEVWFDGAPVAILNLQLNAGVTSSAVKRQARNQTRSRNLVQRSGEDLSPSWCPEGALLPVRATSERMLHAAMPRRGLLPVRAISEQMLHPMVPGGGLEPPRRVSSCGF
jgi:hypothetical protein